MRRKESDVVKDIMQQILDELKSINKKLDAVTSSVKVEINGEKVASLIQSHQKANRDTNPAI